MKPEQSLSHLDPDSFPSLSSLKPDDGGKGEIVIPPALDLSPKEDEHFRDLLVQAKQAKEQGDLPSCLNFLKQYRNEYSQLRAQKEEEQRQREEAERLEREKKAKEEREERLKELLGSEPSETLQNLEKELNLNIKEQYLEQADLLTKTGLIETLPSGQLGFMGLAWKEEKDPHSGETKLAQIEREYLLPSLEQVTAKFLQKIELIGLETLQSKVKQGFAKLLLVPFAKSINDFINCQKQILLAKFKEGEKVLDSDGRYQYSQPHPDSQLFSINADGTTVQLELNIQEPVWQWDQYANSDSSGKIIYYPKQFTDDLDEDGHPLHQGKTKQEILQEQLDQDDPCLGFVLKLIEEGEIPQEGANRIKNDRKRWEANQKPNQYLATLENPESDLGKNPYHQETGLTPEDEISHFITHLEKTNRVINDYQGQGKACYLIGSYLSGKVPYCYWRRGYRRLGLYGYDPDNRYDSSGARSAVML